MNKNFFSLAATATLALPLVFAAPSVYAAETAADFVNEVSIASKFEMDAANIAVSRAQNATVNAYARQMLTDHMSMTEELNDISRKIGFERPAGLRDSYVRLLKDLTDQDTKDFDERYMETQVDVHADTLRIFEDYAANGDNVMLRDFAAKMVPALKIHHDLAKEIDSKL